MNQQEVFANALWVTKKDCKRQDILMLRSHFALRKVKRATLRVIGLGWFHCYLNGVRVGDDQFLPLSTDYEPRQNYPREETVTGHRIYVPEYDVTGLLRERENVLSIHFGGGWYTSFDAASSFGKPKAIWCLFGETEGGSFELGSSEHDRVANSFVKDCAMHYGETHDYTAGLSDAMKTGFDDSAWEAAVPAQPLNTEYLFTDCPADGIRETLPVKQLGVTAQGGIIYDCGKNTSGYPVLKLTGNPGETVEVYVSEELDADGTPSPAFNHNQKLKFICDGTVRTVHPLFSWQGFRYFTVTGSAQVQCVAVVHAKVEQTASFRSDNALLNWIHDTFVNTQLTNMHGGIPSDCPHLERRGYTGDGQLICHSAMDLLDAEAFYRKWIGDIQDCQDVESGHIQYTAPYLHSGGGPGGWGCAIVEVPYLFAMHYGDTSVLKNCYMQMLRYFDYLEEHSWGNLVVSDKDGEWCLGDWCPPVEVILPAPFVNNYFYIKSLYRCIEIARLIGKEEDIPGFEAKIAIRKEAIMAAYFNKWDGNFLGGRQGANAFALDIGLGDHRTYPNLVRYYEKLGGYDTGIFGTELVTRILFERGDGNLAVKLLLSDSVHSFAELRRRGATTLWEYWPESLVDRSHNHPMFGAVTACLYDFLLGIRNKEGSLGYREVEVAPVFVDEIHRLEGHRTLPGGKLSVAYEKKEDAVYVTVTVPAGQKAVFLHGDQRVTLAEGENNLVLAIS